ncbi:phosphoribosyltransferase-like protein [Flavobacterium notoginsengisoli]|uniref:phosphoribosyltransferase-like protein n=1 Tax=Flavobacterium notoginsengisoli TaxID=1478199 RepID=UPI0036279B56
MKEIADKILETIKDYRNDDGFFLDSEYILNWGKQFGEDAEFVLNEFSEIIPKVYVSKERAKIFIDEHIQALIKEFNCSSISQFLIDTEFLDLQLPYKSQPAILNILETLLNEKYGESYIKYKTYPKVNYVYFDDILASGSTIGKHLVNWLGEKNSENISNIENVLKDNYRLSVNLFGLHNWGQAFQEYRLMKTFEDKIKRKITWYHNYEIQNHAKLNNQLLNVAFPTDEQPTNVKSYLANLNADKYEDYAYRKPNLPAVESFFTSAENRVRYENIILQKGISIIEMIQSEIKPNIRPLGLINPSYKTFGLGTHFFTWRNIPNNSPLVFWWGVAGHDWIPLFPVANRG